MLQAVSLSPVTFFSSQGVVGSNDDNEDGVTLLDNNDERSDAESFFTQTTLLSDCCSEEAPEAADGAAHDVQETHKSGSQTSQNAKTTTLGKAPHFSASHLLVRMAPSERPLSDLATQGGVAACGGVNIPQICLLWEKLPSSLHMQPCAARQFLVPAALGGLLDVATARPPPRRLTCVWQVCRGDVLAALRGVDVARPWFTVSRVHCELSFHFSLLQSPRERKNTPASQHCPVYKLRSFDVVDSSSGNGTFCNGVRLFPTHRYSFSAAKEKSSVIDLQLGAYYRLCVKIDGEFLPANEEEEEEEARKEQAKSYAAKRLLQMVDVGVQWAATATTTTTTTTAAAAPSARAKRVSLPQKKPVPRKTRTRQTCSNAPKARTTRQKKCVKSKKEIEPFILPLLSCTEAEMDRKLTIVTTGIRLTSKIEAKLCKINIVVNPDKSEFSRAKYLVIEGPLMRSVKLLTAVPFVQHVVDRAWLSAVLASASTLPPTSSAAEFLSLFSSIDPGLFRYTEQRSESSIETVNKFSLVELFQTPLMDRQTLFTGQFFWVHPEAKPQEPPDNDLRHVILASGGVITKNPAEATVAVMPRVRSTVNMWLEALCCPLEPLCIFVTPNDIFCGVLQQRRLTVSTVRRPCAVSGLAPCVQFSRSGRKRESTFLNDCAGATKKRR